MSTTVTAPTRASLTGKQKAGLVICLIYGLTNIPAVLTPTPDGDTGPPMAILVVGSILGVVALVAAILAWGGNRLATRVGAGAIIVLTLTGLPAFFVDVPMFVKALVAFSVVLTVVAVVLMFSGDRRHPSVTD
jgi:energy-converting hydrogenase Eha subunit B